MKSLELEYIGPEIISEIKRNKRNNIIITQRVNVKCQKCGLIKNIKYGAHKVNRLKALNKTYYCHKCCSRNIISKYNDEHPQLGICYNEKYGKDKADVIKEKQRKNMPKKFIEKRQISGIGHKDPKKNKTYEEYYGIERTKIIKDKFGDRRGKNNPQYGKPAYHGSGNGWSGWYKGWYFRSLRELSFMINYIEENDIKWKSAEEKQYAIPYIHYDGTDRNYFADFILNENMLVEIKPFNLINSPLVKLKTDAAIRWCKNKNMLYNIISDKEYKLLTNKDIKQLVDMGLLKWLSRYQEKYDKEYRT